MKQVLTSTPLQNSRAIGRKLNDPSVTVSICDEKVARRQYGDCAWLAEVSFIVTGHKPETNTELGFFTQDKCICVYNCKVICMQIVRKVYFRLTISSRVNMGYWKNIDTQDYAEVTITRKIRQNVTRKFNLDRFVIGKFAAVSMTRVIIIISTR